MHCTILVINIYYYSFVMKGNGNNVKGKGKAVANSVDCSRCNKCVNDIRGILFY